MYRRLGFTAALILAACAAQLTVFTIPAMAGATAGFVKFDTSTQGSWQGKYGTDGYALANVSPQKLPGYASSFAPQNALSYTWNSSTSDPRALQVPGGSGAIAATWYSTAGFGFTVNFSDGNTHQLSLYAVDWDNQGRSETVTISDANTTTQLDVRTISGFLNGTYAVWNISGSVTITVAFTNGPNGVISGAFFDTPGGGGGGNPETVSIAPPSVNLSANGTQQFSATVANATNQNVTWSILSVNPSSAATGSISSSGVYIAPGAATIATAQVTIQAVSADQTASSTAVVNLTAVKSSVNFVKLDTATEGSWQGNYGADGYALAGGTQSIPTYATFAVESQLDYTWVPDTSDPRALQVPGSTGRIAASWYSVHDAIPPTFSFDVNFTDGNSHQLALYALDWDVQGRVETISILDAASQTQLDSRSISSFTSGTYLVWNVSGHVTINVTLSVGPNSVISGVFFGGSSGGSGGSSLSVSVSPATITLQGGQSAQFTSTVTGATNTAVTWSISPPLGAGTISQSGLYQAPTTVASSQQVTVTALSQQDNTTTGTATVNLTTGGVANYVATDTATEGSWEGIYGADGYAMSGVAFSLPSYATFQVENNANWTYASNTTDPRALEIPGGSGGIASAWYQTPAFSLDVNITDGKLHEVALYAVDWDNGGRSETVQIVDAVSGNILDTRTLTAFTNGVYLVWNISGKVVINISQNSGFNCIVNGVFFGAGNSVSVSVTPHTASLAANQSQAFSASVTGPNQSVTWSISPATGAGTITTGGVYTAPSAITSSQTVTVSATAANSATGTATITLSPGANAGYLGFDTTTQGNWKGVYGSTGYCLAGDDCIPPGFATYAVSNENGEWTWTTATSDQRALEASSFSGRIAAAWYKNHDSFVLDVNFTDGNTHPFALYLLDWDGQGRAETISILDASSGQLLDTRTVSSFVNGIYEKWNITGHVTINVTVTAGANAVISGAFFQ